MPPCNKTHRRKVLNINIFNYVFKEIDDEYIQYFLLENKCRFFYLVTYKHHPPIRLLHHKARIIAKINNSRRVSICIQAMKTCVGEVT